MKLACGLFLVFVCGCAAAEDAGAEGNDDGAGNEPEPKRWGYVPSTGECGADKNKCGPNQWSEVSSTCAEQGTQSPIDATFSTAVQLAASALADFTMTSEVCTEGEFIANAHTTEVSVHETCPNAMYATWKGKQFKLQQYHWHSPSEHTVDGKYYPLEVHHVHQADDGQYLVVAVFIDASTTLEAKCNGAQSVACARARFFQTLQETMPQPPYEHEETMKKRTAPLDPYRNFIPPMDTHFYQYQGSFTTPGCDTDVVWILNPTPVTVFDSSLTLYRQLINRVPDNQLAVIASPFGPEPYFTWDATLGTNNRPIQVLAGANAPARVINIVGESPPAAYDSSGSAYTASGGSSASAETSLASGMSSSVYGERDISGSTKSLGSMASGSSGSFMALWKWIVLVACCWCCLAGCMGGMLKKKKAKKTKKKKSTPAAAQSVPEQVPEAAVSRDPLLPTVPPLVPLMSRSQAFVPSYAMPAQAAPMAYSQAYSPVASGSYTTAVPAMGSYTMAMPAGQVV